ncbi:MAG: hypothetical protein AUI57_08485 [Candidatus Rokubacteria bacterium 13_1_40CM_2_68_8]|nr:MAG: hypothetical protein AUI57_08485 [Candidatus Rokubacteria bacterium 13_1_40CM_2_68_8]PYN82384.1 MAG: hypothetical protein DMD96_06215 [Candidatus Rokubacteria bacterium]
MKTVCMCGSFRHHDEMLALRDALLASGASCEWPTIEQRRDPKTMTVEEAKAAILAHLERMDRADLILIYNKDGHVGNSVVMEIGYAYARRKPLYTLMPIQDSFLMGLVTAVVSPEDFIEVACAGPGALRE